MTNDAIWILGTKIKTFNFVAMQFIMIRFNKIQSLSGFILMVKNCQNRFIDTYEGKTEAIFELKL